MKKTAVPTWRALADRGELGAWLARNKGAPAWLCLSQIAVELPAARTKARRLELAEALERLATPVLNLERPWKGQRGPRDKFQTWRDAALVNALMKHHGAAQPDAVDAVIRGVVRLRGDESKARARIERYLSDAHAGRRINSYSHSPSELERAAALLPKGLHRIK